MKIPTPSANTCVIKEPPPDPKTVKSTDFGLSGETIRPCPEIWEVCLTRNAAVYYLKLENYVQENYAKCQEKAPSPRP